MHTIYTLGYNAWGIQALRSAVEARGALLVDIRYNPTSRRPEWRQGPLRQAFGADYRHLQSLGNLNYKSGGPIELAAPELALSALRPELRRRPIALLCCCPNHTRCHRLVAAEYLARALGAPIEHLYPGV